jgi:hypothetical protein
MTELYSPCIVFAATPFGTVCPPLSLQIRINWTSRQSIEIRDMLQQWVQWDILESLANYHSVAKLLFGIVKDAMNSTRLQVRPVT